MYRYSNHRAKHHRFLEELHVDLLEMTATRFDGLLQAPQLPTPDEQVRSTSDVPDEAPRTSPTEHYCVQIHETRRRGDGVQLRSRQCKVCSLLQPTKPSTTTMRCGDCLDGGAQLPLCNKVKTSRSRTCFRIWHDNWDMGRRIPPELQGKRIYMYRRHSSK